MSTRDVELERTEIAGSTRITRGRMYAVIVGINEYADTPAIPKLRYARADAKAFAELLVDPALGGARTDDVRLLLDEEATHAAILDAVEALRRAANEDDTALFYFAGHGAPVRSRRARDRDGTEKYLLPHDTLAENIPRSGIRLRHLNEYLDELESRRVVCILDCCYSGGAAAGTLSRGFQPPGIRAGIQEYTEEVLQELGGEGRVVLTACGFNEVSVERDDFGHGVYTYHLLAGLRGAADPQQTGRVSVDQVYAYVSERVPADARMMRVNMSPRKKGEVGGQIYLSEYETPSARRARESAPSAAALPPSDSVQADHQRLQGVVAPETGGELRYDQSGRDLWPTAQVRTDDDIARRAQNVSDTAKWPIPLDRVRAALVIGNSAYDYHSLRGPEKDIALIAETLRNAGFRVKKLLNAKKSDILDAWKLVETVATYGGVALLYYSGLGSRVDGEDAMLTVENEHSDSISVSSLMSTIAAFDGTFDGESGELILYSTAPGGSAVDLGHEMDVSPFAKAFASALRNTTGDIHEVFRRTSAETKRLTDGEQTPWVAGSFAGTLNLSDRLSDRNLGIVRLIVFDASRL